MVARTVARKGVGNAPSRPDDRCGTAPAEAAGRSRTRHPDGPSATLFSPCRPACGDADVHQGIRGSAIRPGVCRQARGSVEDGPSAHLPDLERSPVPMHAAPRRPGLVEAVFDPVPLRCRTATAWAGRRAAGGPAEAADVPAETADGPAETVHRTAFRGTAERAWTPWT
ncbi:hypothetical protein GCM10009535_28570 [Streptomyces thermocarboxydovorans]|uniref:Uncharacterized protein n=1 Tax=Streptomyces thermocarboxydovorans TaxID=59298 RepID=A0ABN1HH66_9ACTN